MRMSENEDVQKGAISRRTVTKAMAWAVPVIAVAAPVPAFASGPKPYVEYGPACKSPGGSGHCDWFKFGYGVNGVVHNDSNKDIYLYTVTIIAQSPSEPSFVGKTAQLPIKIAANSTLDMLFAGVSTKSANVTNGSLTFSVTWGHTPTASGDPDHVNDPLVFTITWASTPPGDCDCL